MSVPGRRKRTTGAAALSSRGGSTLELTLAAQIIQSSIIPEPVREYRFSAKRRFRFDFCWLNERIAVEVEGGTWTGSGRHSRGQGFENDATKYNLAVSEGWALYRFTSSMVRDGRAIAFLESIWRKA